MITIGIGGVLLLLFPIGPFVAAILMRSVEKERLQIWIFVISAVLAVAFSVAYSKLLGFADERSTGILDDLFVKFYGNLTYPLLYYGMIAGLLVLGLKMKRDRTEPSINE